MRIRYSARRIIKRAMSLYKDFVQSPLAERMRPKNFDEFLGQDELTSAESPLRRMLEGGNVHSMILWGPPGVGKTSLGYIMANMIKAEKQIGLLQPINWHFFGMHRFKPVKIFLCAISSAFDEGAVFCVIKILMSNKLFDR